MNVGAAHRDVRWGLAHPVFGHYMRGFRYEASHLMESRMLDMHIPENNSFRVIEFLYFRWVNIMEVAR